MGRMYTARFSAISVSAIQDLWEIVAPADSIVVLHQFLLGQTSDTGDSEEELLTLSIERGATTSGSGGAAVTPEALELGMPAFGGTCERNNTTQASGGTIDILHTDTWNIRTKEQMIWTPETRPVISPSQRLIIELTAPADAITCNSTVYFEEIGG